MNTFYEIKNFWADLPKPFFVLAPMYDVTDTVFRSLVAKYSSPDVMFTEFVSVDGLLHEKGRENIINHLWFEKTNAKIVAQVHGKIPENFEKVAVFIKEMGFDGIDINMGCPEKSAVKNGTCAALINNPRRAQEIIFATKAGAGTMPVSVKTRIGFNEESLDTWIPALLETEPAALTIHARTKKQMSQVPADWNYIKRVVEIRDAYFANTHKNKIHDISVQKNISVKNRTVTTVIGNGDVKNISDAQEKVRETGVDGVMLGRAAFGNPWLFNKKEDHVTLIKKLEVLKEHTYNYEHVFNNIKSFEIMRRHFKAYVNDFPRAKELRIELMTCEDASSVAKKIDEFLKTLKYPIK